MISLGAEDYFERGQDFFRLPGFKKQPGWAAQTYGNAARNAWIMGDEVSAQQRIDHALSIASENDNPYDMAFAQHMAANHAVLTGNLMLAGRLLIFYQSLRQAWLFAVRRDFADRLGTGQGRLW